MSARLDPFPGVNVALLESNGPQNYRDWERLKSFHPLNGADWMNVNDGVFVLGEEFYTKSGGVLEESGHYMGLFPK